jgi:signal transduction histidine kinase/ActR/RegA family two-component response regulator
MMAARRTLLMFAIGLMLPLVIAAAVLEASLLREERHGLIHRAADHAAFAAALIDRELVSHERAMQMVAQSPAFDGGFDEAPFKLLATRLVADEPLWRTISVARPDGVRIVDVPVAIAGRQGGAVVEIDSLRRAVDSRRPVVGDVTAGPHGRTGFAVRAPVARGDGPVTYVVSAVVEPSAFADLLLPRDLPRGWTAQAVDGSGRIVATTDPARGNMGSVVPAAQGGGRAPFRIVSPNGGEAVGSIGPVPGVGWSVRVLMPVQAFNAPVVEAVAVLTGGGLVSALLALLLAGLIRRELREHRRALAAAAQRQKLEALGRLTGGVAHDFNNLLTPILGGLDLLARRLAGDPKSARLAEGALASAERAKALVSRLLSFSRRQELAPRSTQAAELLAGLTELIEHTVGAKIGLALEVAPNLPPIEVDPIQLELAVLNLAVNARDAMPEGGRLTLAADQPALGERRPRGLPPGRYVRISVIDTGAGMDPATLRRAVEPFFTTKDVGKGTGLGLSMVHGLAVQSGGALQLQSAVGVGTTAEIWLPAAAALASQAAGSAPAADRRTSRILLVDDEPLVRASAAAILADHGHQVVEAASAAEALDLLESDGTIGALVTDFAMPVRSGAELVEAAWAIRPGLPALIVTGFADLARLPPGVKVLAKPFRRDELLGAVAEVLRQGVSSSDEAISPT